MADGLTSVFVSCGATYTPAQEEFATCIEAYLRSHGYEPQTVGRGPNEYPLRQPVEEAKEFIKKCDGAVIIAFERMRVLRGLDKPDSAEQKEIGQEAHPTIWNQMEAAMAYAQDIPLLIFVEKGLRRQGMLSDRLEWMAIETNLLPSLVATEGFRRVFEKWRSLVKSRGESRAAMKISDGRWRVKDLIGIFANLEAKEGWALIIAVFAIFATIATVSFKIGQWGH